MDKKKVDKTKNGRRSQSNYRLWNALNLRVPQRLSLSLIALRSKEVMYSIKRVFSPCRHHYFRVWLSKMSIVSSTLMN